MPNRNGFITRDPRPDVHNVACMHGCRRGPVKVTSDLAKSLGVTPAQAAADARATASPGAAVANVPPPAFADVQRIVAQRCAACHAQHPTQPGFASAAGGMMLDTPERIKAAAARINAVAVKSRRMPLGNVTHMTDDERATLGRWIAGGAKT
ncbi:MAG: hypothetical protein GIW95_02565 [Candidatus Eremiobacteraeota bacterium]|nr:hypothetical protein [Candidatus Eremiobacteraeota bacterium]